MCLFVEDVGQENLVHGLVRRLADLEIAGRQEPELASFCDDVRTALRLLSLAGRHQPPKLQP
ncbi:MAG: hypothetical protein ACR2K2_10650 [Mycobacteriales bacterium]